MVALAGLLAAKYALHSLRTGVATFLSAGGGSADVVQREGGCKSDAYKGYVRSHVVDAYAVSDMLTNTDTKQDLQPGQRTVWDNNG